MAPGTGNQASPGTFRSLNISVVANMYSLAMQLLLLSGILTLETQVQAMGLSNSKTIKGVTCGFKLRPRAASQRSSELYAVCHMQPSLELAAGQPSVTGYVLFYQRRPADKLQAYFQLSGFPQDPDQPLRAIHVHQFGDLSGGCTSTGPHYNPYRVNHPHHPGDFNNFQVRDGKILEHLTELRATLYGAESILGRGVVLHAHEDDLGLGGNPASLQNGNSGPRLACCTIGRSNGGLWKKTVPSA
ncbi:extracellular superoxide dismutase [Cu-Zn]-like [Mustelus asterias]